MKIVKGTPLGAERHSRKDLSAFKNLITLSLQQLSVHPFDLRGSADLS